jgi:hypothetical protein
VIGVCNINSGEEEPIKVIGGKAGGKRPLGRPRRRWAVNIKIDLAKDSAHFLQATYHIKVKFLHDNVTFFSETVRPTLSFLLYLPQLSAGSLFPPSSGQYCSLPSQLTATPAVR